MSLLHSISQRFRDQRARKSEVFTPGGGVDLQKMHDWLAHKGGATGKLIHLKTGFDGKSIASTSRFSGYQTLKQKIGSHSGWRKEAADAANPMQLFLNTVKARYGNDEAAMIAVEQVRTAYSGHGTRLFDTAQLRAALLALAPLQKAMRAPQHAQPVPKHVAFSAENKEHDIPMRVKAKPAVSAQPAAEQPAQPLTPTQKLTPSDAKPQSKIDLRAAVAATQIPISRSDWLDAHALLTKYAQNPEREQDHLWTLLQLAHEHAAGRTETMTHPWDLSDAEDIQDGVSKLLNTPVFLLLRQTKPSEFEAVCRDYDALGV